MSEKQYELKEYDNGLFIQDNENNKVQYYSQSKASMDKIVDLLNEQDKKIKELDKYCTACDDTLLTIQELTYKLLTIDFKDIETKVDYCHLLNELDNKDLSFIHDCIKSINKCDLLEMEKLKREYGDV